VLDALFAIAPVLGILVLPVVALLAIAETIDSAENFDEDGQ
jgi:hypothetical protein